MSSLIGALRVTLGADTSKFEAGMNRSRKSAKQAETSIVASLGRIQERFTKLGMGLATGVLAGTFLLQAKMALQYASSLSEVARQTGTTVEQYQVLRQMAREAGVEEDKLNASLKRTNIILGEAKRGVPAAVRALANLGITADQLKNFRHAGDIFPKLMEGIRNIGDESVKAAAGKRVFGKAVGDLIPMLDQGEAAYIRVNAEMVRMGLLSQEHADKADAAMDAMDRLGQGLKTRLAVALMENEGAVHGVTNALADMIETAGAAIKWLKKLELQSLRVGAQRRVEYATAGEKLGLAKKGAAERAKSEQRKIEAEYMDFISADFRARFALPHTKPKGRQAPIIGEGDDGVKLGGGGGGRARPRRGGGGGGKSAEQRAEEARRQREDQLQEEYDRATELRRAEIDILRAQQDLATTAEHRYSIEREILGHENAQEQAALKLAVETGKLSQAEADSLEMKHIILAELKAEEIARRETREAAEHSAELGDINADMERDRLEFEAEGARTSEERRRIELELLDLAYRQERARLDAVIADEHASKAAKEIAEAQRRGLDGRRARDADRVNRENLGPLAAYMDSLPRTAAEMRESFESVAVDGIGRMTDEFASAAAGLLKLKGAWGSLAAQILSDLARIAIANALAQLFKAAAPSAGGSAPSDGMLNAFGGFTPRAIGGPVRAGGRYLVGERGPELLQMGGMAGTIIPNHKMGQAIRTPRGGGGGGVTVVINADRSVVTEEIKGWVAEGVQIATANGARLGTTSTLRHLSRSQRTKL